MSLDPGLKCPVCGSSRLYEDEFYDDDGERDVDIICEDCGYKQ